MVRSLPARSGGGRVALAALAGATLLALAGCGGDEGGAGEGRPATDATSGASAAAGAEVFASAGCGDCHTLADAGTSGAVGPNLDDAQPDRALVVERVTSGKGAMPSFADRLSSAEIEDVATYVASAT